MSDYDDYIIERQDELGYLGNLFGVDSDWDDLTEEDLAELHGMKVA